MMPSFSLKNWLKYFCLICFLFTVVHICGHCFNLTNLVESQSKADTEIEQHLSQLDNPWLNPIRESGVVSWKQLFGIEICDLLEIVINFFEIMTVSCKAKYDWALIL